MKRTTSCKTSDNQNPAQNKKRSIQTFEPCGPIMEMITLEMNNRTRNRLNCHGEKRRMFEDIIAAALGKKYPKLNERFQIIRQEEIS